MSDFFTEELAKTYDQKNSGLAPIADNLHFLVRMVLAGLPERARILCVGVGTGAEILSLSKEYPGWSFVGIDPSAPMLEVCRERLKREGVMDRCELIHGYAQDIPDREKFDAALCILVAHFIKREQRPSFYENILRRLKAGAYLVSAEISFDFDSKAFPSMMENWARVQLKMGATPESLQSLPQMLREALGVIPPSETEDLLRAAGISCPIRFFQAFMITGWYGRKA